MIRVLHSPDYPGFGAGHETPPPPPPWLTEGLAPARPAGGAPASGAAAPGPPRREAAFGGGEASPMAAGPAPRPFRAAEPPPALPAMESELDTPGDFREQPTDRDFRGPQPFSSAPPQAHAPQQPQGFAVDREPDTDHHPSMFAPPTPSSERAIVQEHSGLRYEAESEPQVPAYFAEQGYTHDPTAPQGHFADYQELNQQHGFDPGHPAQAADAYGADYSGYYDENAQPQFDEYGNPIQQDAQWGAAQQGYDPNQQAWDPGAAGGGVPYDQEGYPQQSGYDAYGGGSAMPPGGYAPPSRQPQGGGIIRGFDDPFAGLSPEERQRRMDAQQVGLGQDHAYVTPLPISGVPPGSGSPYGAPSYAGGAPAQPSGEYPVGGAGFGRPTTPPPPRAEYGASGSFPVPPAADSGAYGAGASYSPPSTSFPPPPTSQIARGGSPFEAPDLPLPSSPIAGRSGAPSPPSPAAAGGPSEGISSAPVVASAPGFQQLSIAHLKKGEDGAGFTLPEPADDEEKMDDLMGSMVPLSTDAVGKPGRNAAQATSLYTGSLGKDSKGERAVDDSGKPRFVPEIPAPTEDDSAPGRRLAGGAWMLFAVIFSLAFALIGKMNLGGAVLVPAFLMGALLITGQRWAGWLGLLVGLAYGGFFAWAGYDLQFGETVRAVEGLNVLKAPVAIALMAVGLVVIVANMVMLIGSAGLVRASLGGVLMVLSAVLFVPVMALKGPAASPFSSPAAGWGERQIGSGEEGFLLTKPKEWGSFDWVQVQRHLRFAGNLTTEPTSHFVNRKANMLVAIYVADLPPGAAMAAALLRALPVPQIETEIIRELKTNREPTSYEYADHRFEENVYAGRVGTGTSTLTMLHKTRLGEKMFLFVVLRDPNGTATQQDADNAVDEFFADLSFTAPDK